MPSGAPTPLGMAPCEPGEIAPEPTLRGPAINMLLPPIPLRRDAGQKHGTKIFPILPTSDFPIFLLTADLLPNIMLT